MTTLFVPRVETHLLASKHVDQIFQVQVMQPLTRKGAGETFPALYLTDANAAFDVAKGISHGLHIAGQVRRYILIGIGYPGDNPFAGSLLRGRDMTSARRAAPPGYPESLPIEGVPGIEPGGKRWSGAPDFIAFIRDELIPFIDGRYPTVAGERSYFGHSMGGGFGLHALFSQAGLFNRYIISSPGLAIDEDDHGIQEARQFIASGASLDAQVVMSVGGEEEFESEPARFVSSFYRLAALLRSAQLAGLSFSSRVYPGESHVSVWPIAFTHGVQAIYGPAAEGSPLSAAMATSAHDS